MHLCPGSGLIETSILLWSFTLIEMYMILKPKSRSHKVCVTFSILTAGSMPSRSRVSGIPVSETYQTTYAQRQRLRRNSLPIEDFRRKRPTNPKSSVFFKFNLESGRSGRKSSFGSDFRGLQANPCLKIKGVVQKAVQKSVLKNSRFFRKFLKKMELFKNLQI